MIVHARDAALYVEVTGDGPPLLSISGSGSSLADRFAAPPPALLEHFTVASFDHRGLGQSNGEDRPLTMVDFAADGFAVADALGWDRFAVLGPSFGGMVALEMAVTEPPRISRLALCCTSSGGEGGSSYPLHERPEPLQALQLADTRPESWPDLIALMSNRPVPREPGYERQLHARRTHDVWSRLSHITAPTLIAMGRYDLIAPPANGEAIASQVAGARCEAFEGGHAFLYQDPRAWPLVVDFLLGATSP